MRPGFFLVGALLALTLTACSPCGDYCATQCECDGDGSDACVEGCLETMDLYSPDVRQDECAERLDVLEEECR